MTSQLEQLYQICCKKFPILVLVDLNGTLFHRTSEKDARNWTFSEKIKAYFYFYRPGHEEFLLRLYNHPRI
jgi:NLI interacting factor-like phosphatase